MIGQPIFGRLLCAIYLCCATQPIYHCILYQSFLDDIRPLFWQRGLLIVSCVYEWTTFSRFGGLYSSENYFGAISFPTLEIVVNLGIYLVPHIDNFWFLFVTWILQLQILKARVSNNLPSCHTISCIWWLFTVLLSFIGNMFCAYGDHIRRVHPYRLGKEFRWKVSWHIYMTMPFGLSLLIPRHDECRLDNKISVSPFSSRWLGLCEKS